MPSPNHEEVRAEIHLMEDCRTDQSLGQVTDSDPKTSAGDAAHHTINSSAAEADGDHDGANPRPVIEASASSDSTDGIARPVIEAPVSSDRTNNFARPVIEASVSSDGTDNIARLVIEASVSSDSTDNISVCVYPFSDIIGEGIFEDMAHYYSRGQYEKSLQSLPAGPSAGHKLKALSLDNSEDERKKAPVKRKGNKKGKKKGKAEGKQQQEESSKVVEAMGKGKAKATKHENEDFFEDEESDASTIRASSQIKGLDFHSTYGGFNSTFKTKDDIGSTHLKPLLEHVLDHKPAEEMTEEEHGLFLFNFAKKVRDGKIVRPKFAQRVAIAMRRDIMHSPSEYEPCVRMNRTIDRMIGKWLNGSGVSLNPETTEPSQDVYQPLEESSIEATYRRSATQSCMENTEGECDSDYGEETKDDDDETVGLTRPIGFTHLDKATQKRILEMAMPTGIQLFPFASMPNSGYQASENVIKLKTAMNIIQALCKRRDPKVLLGGELARNILYRTNSFVFKHVSCCISFVGTVGVENMARISFQNFAFAREIFPAEARTRDFTWLQRWMSEIRNLMRGENLVQGIAEWYQQSLHPSHPVVSAARAMFEVWELEQKVAAVVATSKVESGEANPRVASVDCGKGFGNVQKDLDALLEKAGL